MTCQDPAGSTIDDNVIAYVAACIDAVITECQASLSVVFTGFSQ